MHDTHFTVTVFSHHFEVSRLTPRGREFCVEFARQFIAWGFKRERGRNIRYMAKVFAAADSQRTYFRFHINCLTSFKERAIDAGFSDKLVTWMNGPPMTPVPALLPIREQWVARDYQEEMIQYLTQEKPVSKLIPLQTGKGKGVCAAMAASRIGSRVGIMVQSKYTIKWQLELLEYYAISPDRIMMIEGSASLMALFELAREDRLDADILIFSIETLQRWLALYEQMGEGMRALGYACTPRDWFQHLGIGTRIVDESHQKFHLLFKLDLYTHVARSIDLTATLLTTDPFLAKMHELKFPLVDRPKNLALDKYATAFAVHFNFDDPNKIRTTERGSNSYSHNALEASIIAHPPTLKNYLALVDSILVEGYFKHPREKKRAIVFASSIDMCTKMTEYFSKKYPHLDIRRYVGEDPYENAIEPDIRFTTNGSCGAAIDIPDLVCNILTQAISSIQANVQVLGRLRKLSDGSVVNFYFFTADNIPKHVEYYVQKKEMLDERAANFKEIFVNLRV